MPKSVEGRRLDERLASQRVAPAAGKGRSVRRRAALQSRALRPRHRSPRQQEAEPPPEAEPEEAPQCAMVGIGASAGGLEALQEFFSAIPADSGLAFLVVTHMHPEHRSLLPELLARCTDMPVQEITESMPARPFPSPSPCPGST